MNEVTSTEVASNVTTITIKNKTFELDVFDMLSSEGASHPTNLDQLREAIANRQAMSLAQRLWKNLESKANIENEKDRSKVFRFIMSQYFNMATAASTYLHNIRNGMYATNKAWNKKQRKTPVVVQESSESSVDFESGVPVSQISDSVEDSVVSEPVVESSTEHRWKIEDSNDVVITSFPSRSAAQQYAKENKALGYKWVDGNVKKVTV